MKNIQLIPTNKPSRYVTNYMEQTMQWQHIYIISDEKIKEGDWCIVDGGLGRVGVDTFQSNVRYSVTPKKIILTTDQDLINDDVQAIDDEFLHWFVKNPSCEEVYVEEEDYSQKCRECGETVKRGYNCTKKCFMKSGNFIPTDKNIKYKIIIPKEEPLIEFTLIEKELIEEAKKLWQESHPNPIEMALFGAKWQQERSYSEEEVKDLIEDWTKMANGLNLNFPKDNFNKWFEKIKKK